MSKRSQTRKFERARQDLIDTLSNRSDVPNFIRDKELGEKAEALIALVIGGTKITDKDKLDWGDLLIEKSGVYIEIKTDFRATDTGNIALELLDTPLKGSVTRGTGVIKSVYHKKPTLYIHMVGVAEKFYVYDPHDVVHYFRKNPNMFLKLRPVFNKRGEYNTINAIMEMKNLPACFEQTDLEGLSEVVENWEFEEQISFSAEELHDIYTSILDAYGVADNIEYLRGSILIKGETPPKPPAPEFDRTQHRRPSISRTPIIVES